MGYPPHLPKKNNQTEISKVVILVTLLSVFFGILSGVTASLIMTAWVTPPVQIISSISNDVWEPQLSSNNISNQKERQISERIITIVSKKATMQSAFNMNTAYQGDAVVLSTDGWAVVRDTEFFIGKEKDWIGIDRKGDLYPIQIVYPEKVSGLVYLKFIGNDFQVSSLVDQNDISIGTEVVHAQKYTFQTNRISGITEVEGQYIDEPTKKFTLQGSNLSGPIFTNEGRFIGFADSGILTLNYKIQYDIPFVLNGNILSGHILPISGYPISDIILTNGLKKQPGFFVTKVPKQFLGKIVYGDVITHINDVGYSEMETPRQLFFSSSEITLTIIRNKVEEKIVVSLK